MPSFTHELIHAHTHRYATNGLTTWHPGAMRSYHIVNAIKPTVQTTLLHFRTTPVKNHNVKNSSERGRNLRLHV